MVEGDKRNNKKKKKKKPPTTGWGIYRNLATLVPASSSSKQKAKASPPVGVAGAQSDEVVLLTRRCRHARAFLQNRCVDVEASGAGGCWSAHEVQGVVRAFLMNEGEPECRGNAESAPTPRRWMVDNVALCLAQVPYTDDEALQELRASVEQVPLTRHKVLEMYMRVVGHALFAQHDTKRCSGVTLYATMGIAFIAELCTREEEGNGGHGALWHAKELRHHLQRSEYKEKLATVYRSMVTGSVD